MLVSYVYWLRNIKQIEISLKHLKHSVNAEKNIALERKKILGNDIIDCLVWRQEGHPASKTNRSNTTIELQHLWE